MDPKRAYLSKTIKRKGETYRSISILIGKNEAYIQQYIYRSSPQNLDVEDALRIANYLDVAFASLFGATGNEFSGKGSIQVPFCSDSWGYVSFEHLENYVECSPILFGDINLRDGSFFLLRIKGHVPSPVTGADGIVLVRLLPQSWSKTSGIYALKVNGELIIRQLDFRDGAVNATPWNGDSAHHSLTEKKIDSDCVVGQVVWAANALANVDSEH